MKVKITTDKLHGACLKTGKVYQIHHQAKDGRDLTSLASIAAKSYWFTRDNPQFTPGSIQEALLLENGRIKIIDPKVG